MENQGLSYVHHLGNYPLIYRTIGQQLELTANKFPEREALVVCHEGKRFTYLEFLEKVDKLAASFRRMGFKVGDHIGIWAPNTSSWLLTMMAIARIGCVAVTLNYSYQVPEMEFCIRKVKLKAIITLEKHRSQNYYKMLCDMIPEIQTQRNKCIESTSYPYLKAIIVDSENHLNGTFNFSDLLDTEITSNELADIKQLQQKISPDSCCYILFTSGTTGNPKAVMVRHFRSINSGHHMGDRQGFNERHHKICMQVPLFHAFGVESAVMSAICKGGTIVIPSLTFNAIDSIRSIQEENCTCVFGVPTMFIDMIETVKVNAIKVNPIEVAVLAGSSFSHTLLNDMKNVLNVQVLCTELGMTETGATFQMFFRDSEEMLLHYVGHCQDHIEAKVVDLQGQMVPFGTPGELLVRGYNIMLGYYDDEQKTRDVIDQCQWFRTGDKFILYENGYGKIIGRIKEVIIRGGENISPKEIENVLHQHPDIAEAHVVGIPSKRLGEEICAFIRLTSKKLSICEEDVQEFCHGRIARYKIPRHIIVVDKFPVNHSGKVPKQRLVEIFEKLHKSEIN